jgi:hypothetical protein
MLIDELPNFSTVTELLFELSDFLWLPYVGFLRHLVVTSPLIAAFGRRQGRRGQQRVLHLAIDLHIVDWVKSLWEAGADVGIANDEGETPTDLAERVYDGEILDLFRLHKERMQP